MSLSWDGGVALQAVPPPGPPGRGAGHPGGRLAALLDLVSRSRNPTWNMNMYFDAEASMVRGPWKRGGWTLQMGRRGTGDGGHAQTASRTDAQSAQPPDPLPCCPPVTHDSLASSASSSSMKSSGGGRSRGK